MPWVKLDDKFRHHPKMIEAGAIGIAVYVCGLSYAAEYLTDGFIATRAVRTLVSLDDVIIRGMNEWDDIDPLDVADGLVNFGLWDKVDGGYVIHDYLEYNPSKADVLAERAAKQAAGKAGGLASASARAQASATADAQAKSKPVPVPVPVPVPRETLPSPSKRGRRKNGTSPRQLGENPRANGTSPRQERQNMKTGPTNIHAILTAIQTKGKA